MAFKRSLLSKVFRSDSDEEEKEVQEETEQAKEANTEDEKPPRPKAPELELPTGHALNRLREVKVAQSGWMPFPELRLDSTLEQYEPYSEGDGKRELSRLKVMITATANRRLAMTKVKEGEEIPDEDAQVDVFITLDQLTAWVIAYPPLGKGKELNKEILSKALEEREVSFGLQQEVLDHLPASKKRYFRLVLVALGNRAVDGTDGYVEDLFSREVKKTASVDEFGRVDYTSLDLIQNINKGDTICKIFPPTQGVAGRTVQDKEITARDGRQAVVPRGRNTEISSDGTRLIASQTGHVEFSARTFQVKAVFYVNGNVDFSTGNVNFWGDVHVRGDVCSGFIVRATGTITVDGVVKSSTIEAGCDLVVARGIQGNDQAVIRAHRGVYAKYLEHCSVYTRELLQADSLLNCDVYSDGSVEVTSGRGTIVGGTVRAAHAVKAKIIGSKSGAATVVAMGGRPYEVFEYRDLKKELKNLEDELEKLNLQPDSRAKALQITKVKMKIITSKNKLKQFGKELEMLAEEFQEEKRIDEIEEEEEVQLDDILLEDFELDDILAEDIQEDEFLEDDIEEEEEYEEEEEEKDYGKVVCDTVYPGTKLVFGKVSMLLNQEVSKCNAIRTGKEISLQ